ncbi:tyrosine-type recombinase/integrase [Planctomycetota bacterium]
MVKKKRKPETPIGLNKILTPTEEKRFKDYLVSVQNDPDGVKRLLIFDIMLNTGLRVSELCKLRVKDTPKYQGGNVIQIHRGKGQKTRNIPVSDRIRRNINIYIKVYRPATLPGHIRPSDSRRQLFFSRTKKRYNRRSVAYLISQLGKKAGIAKHLTPHMCRHTFATRLLVDRKVTLAELQMLLGHSKISSTQKYLHVIDLLNPTVANAIDGGGGVL